MSPFLLLCLSLPLISATVSLEDHEGKFITYCFQKSLLQKGTQISFSRPLHVLRDNVCSLTTQNTSNRPVFIVDLDGTLRVSIPMEMPLRPLLGSKVVVPCYFQDNTVSDPGAPTISPLSHRIKWTYVTKEKTTTILVASEGKIHVETEYLDRVTMINYPLVPTDASIEITELRSKDSGTYRCEVMHGIEDNYDSVNIQVQGTQQKQLYFMPHVSNNREVLHTTAWNRQNHQCKSFRDI